MSPGRRRQPVPLSQYLAIHRSHMDSYLKNGFVEVDGVAFDADDGQVFAEGEIHCEGGIRIKVRKRLVPVTGGPDPTVSTHFYSYNVSLDGVGNIFRYDSPEQGATDDRAEHHVHRYDLLDGDDVGQVKAIFDVQAVPTLGDVIMEAREWYHSNYDRVHDTIHNLHALGDQ